MQHTTVAYRDRPSRIDTTHTRHVLYLGWIYFWEFLLIIFLILIKRKFFQIPQGLILKELMDIGMKIYVRLSLDHRRGIKTEENSKFVAAAWGTEIIQFLVALAILH